MKRDEAALKSVNEDFKQSQPMKPGLLEPLRKTDLMESFKQDKAEVKLRALRWVVVRDIVVSLRGPIVVGLVALAFAILEPTLAKRVLRTIVMQGLGQRAIVSDAGTTAPTSPDEQHADKSRHAAQTR